MIVIATNNNFQQNNLLHALFFSRHALGSVLLTLILALGLATPAFAEDEEEQESSGSNEALLEEVMVTARKRQELAQTVPVAITAFGAKQLEALKIRDLGNLSVGIPNVAMDDIGTFRSIANFSIRGLGINSSIPSIDPTVGVFIDGVYMGQPAGIVIDMFDIQSIEVLRGPQGTLFGRNVTGGAVLINSKRPGEELEFTVRAALDGNPNGDGGLTSYVMGAIGGPVTDTFGARLSIYHTDDNGWFVNLANGKNFGEAKTTIFRPVITWEPSDSLSMILRWDHTKSDGDGPASQNHINGRGVPGFFATFERDSFDFAIDEEGFYKFKNDLVTFQIDWDVSFGDGTVTNIFGWRKYTSDARSDIDAQPVWLFHAPARNNSEQYSNELRYVGNFGKVGVTSGIYWFSNEINYAEQRDLLGIATGGVAPAATQSGGGDYWVDTWALFTTLDYYLTDAWTLTAGLRYSHERKKVNIATLTRNVNAPCDVVAGTCPFDFIDKDSWNSWSWKLGAQYDISDDHRLYAHWTRGLRSGGYNLRNTAIDVVNLGPGPFDEETVDSYELGYKSELGGRGRLNAAVFYTHIRDMQRELNVASPLVGILQVIKNTADVGIWGAEVEGTFALGDHTLLLASVGYVDPKYKTVLFDLNGDGVVDDKDKDLDLPRAAPWTYSIGLNYDIQVNDRGYFTARINYAYRDKSFFTDDNNGWLLAQNILDAGLDYRTAGGRWVFSIYGRNLLSDVKHGGDSQLPNDLVGVAPVGGTFSPLAKGRVLGFEVTFDY
jgi:iron complex outermembrane receptor protein